MRFIPFCVAALVLFSGCGRPSDARHPEDAVATESGGRHEPESREERAILDRVADLPAGVHAKVGEKTLTASRPYHAASGYHCRTVTIQGGESEQRRLACGDDEGWFFVPDVYHQGKLVEESPEPVVRVSPTGEATVVDSSRSPLRDSASSGGERQEEGL